MKRGVNAGVWVAALLPAFVIGACDQQPAKPAAVAAPAPVAAGPNAAETYRAAWGKIDDDLSNAAGAVSLDQSGLKLDQGGDAEEVKRLLRDQQPVVAELMKAGTMGSCDFGLKYDPKKVQEQMPALLEVTGSMRKAARVLRADAARTWVEGDTDGAVDRVVAIYVMCAQVSDEPGVIVALTNSAVISMANDTARKMAAGAGGKSLSAAQKARLLAAMDRLNRADPAGVARARKIEGDADATVGQKMDQAHLKLTSDLATLRRELGGN